MTPFLRRPGALLPRVAAVTGLLLVGGAAGHFVGPPTVNALPAATDRAQATLAPVTGAALAPGDGQVTMPDVLALDLDVARRVLTDAHVNVAIRTATRPAAGDVGNVLAQTPGAGQPVTGPVTLTLATTAAMPDLRDVSLASARTQLERLGAVVSVTRLVRPTARPDTVAASTPAAGQPVPAVVTLAVNDPGQGLSLAALAAVDSAGCETTSQASVNGVDVKDSVTCSASAGAQTYSEWNLARKVALLTARVGLDDNGTAGTVGLRIIGDGRVLTEQTIRFGTSTELRLPVTGILRMRVELTSSSVNSVTLILGDATLLASEADLAALSGQP